MGGVSSSLPSLSPRRRRNRAGRRTEQGPAPGSPPEFISAKTGASRRTGKTEIGQNIRTSLAQTVGDELRVPLGAIVRHGRHRPDAIRRRHVGSLTTPRMAPQLARAAATAREMLIDEAAKRWQADRSTLSARDGKILRPTGGRSDTASSRRAGSCGRRRRRCDTRDDRWALRGTARRRSTAAHS